MMLIILDKHSVYAARLVPGKLKFKQLLELCQLICSCGYCDIYKKVRQGKELQEWIKKHPGWVKAYAIELFNWCFKNIKMKTKTMGDFMNIIASIKANCEDTVETAIFRYVKEYKCIYKSNIELPIDIAIEEYKKYIEWEGANKCKKN